MAAFTLSRLCGRKTGFIFSESLFSGFTQQNYTNRVYALQKLATGCFIRRQSDFTSDKSSNITKRGSNPPEITSENQEFPQSKLLKVAIIGEANSGKSTLTNCLIGEKVCAVTAVPHTTRRQTIGVFTVGDSQIVLLDTPGIVNIPEARRLKMSRQHMRAPREALHDADLIAVLIDATDRKRNRTIHETILTSLENHPDLPSILILNKIDNVKTKSVLLEIANTLLQDREKDDWGYKSVGGWSKFEHVFMVSAKTGDGVDELTEYFAVKSKPSEWLFPADVCTDQNFEQIMQEIFREKLLLLYEHEIPWQIRQVSVLCEAREGHWRIHHKLYCRKKSQRRCVLEKLDQLRGLVLEDLEKIVGQQVDLTVDVSYSEKVGFDTPLHRY
ncbi:hypothetical protein ACROYT_G037803 [Oculina patagonica]